MKTTLEERLRVAREVYERKLPPEEFERRLAATRTAEADAERRAQMQWFCRRYPTALARLRYVTERTRAWTRGRPKDANPR